MLLFSIIWCIFNTMVFGVLLVGTNTNVMIPSFLLLIVEALLMKTISKKFQFSPQEWAVFFSVVVIKVNANRNSFHATMNACVAEATRPGTAIGTIT